MVRGNGSQAALVVVGVDTHKDEHVAVAVDQMGVRLCERRVATTIPGATDLERWACGLGGVVAFGIEGTGSYGAGLSRFLTARGYTVVEVNRPDRSVRRRNGKSDPTDAEMAARAVLAGVARTTPKPARLPSQAWIRSKCSGCLELPGTQRSRPAPRR